MGILSDFFGFGNSRENELSDIVDLINGFEDNVRSFSKEDFRKKTDEYKSIIMECTRELSLKVELEKNKLDGLSGIDRSVAEQEIEVLEKEILKTERDAMDKILPEAYALVREAAVRTIGLRPYDVQMMAGIAMYQGDVVEQKTGEGKTLSAVMPLYLRALAGKGAHLVTPNDYLTKVGVQNMGPVFDYLGLSVGMLRSVGKNSQFDSFVYEKGVIGSQKDMVDLKSVSRKEAYQADITYGTGNEFGFDYLRDNLVNDIDQKVRRDQYFCIVDEVDNVLIDQARTPLIISAKSNDVEEGYLLFKDIVSGLSPVLNYDPDDLVDQDKDMIMGVDGDYVFDEKRNNVYLTEMGLRNVEAALGKGSLYEGDNMYLLPYLDRMLTAYAAFERDVDYVIVDDSIVIVDQNTGRLMPGRRFSDGLHRAIEVKEGVKVMSSSVTMGRISLQSFFRKYDIFSGMTGTAATTAEEFYEIYGSDVTVVPTNEPMIRKDEPDRMYINRADKIMAIIEEVKRINTEGRPILIGTKSVDASEELSRLLDRAGIAHDVLNAKNHEREGEIIAQAGRSGKVTIATNMAGRGVDIKLGGDPYMYAMQILCGYDGDEITDALKEKVFEDVKRECMSDREKAVSLGGLHVIGSERHEARRIDDQLIGRAGRQGDPGSSRFFLSLDDDLCRLFMSDNARKRFQNFANDNTEYLENDAVTFAIKNAQERIEGLHQDIRKSIFEYDEVLDFQRDGFYGERDHALKRDDIKDLIFEFVGERIRSIVREGLQEDMDNGNIDDTISDRANLGKVIDKVRSVFGYDVRTEKENMCDLFISDGADALAGFLYSEIVDYYQGLEERMGEKVLRTIEKRYFVSSMDRNWCNHLTRLDVLKEGIGLRAYGQQDPFVSYERESFYMWNDMVDQVKKDTVEGIFGYCKRMDRRQVKVRVITKEEYDTIRDKMIVSV